MCVCVGGGVANEHRSTRVVWSFLTPKSAATDSRGPFHALGARACVSGCRVALCIAFGVFSPFRCTPFWHVAPGCSLSAPFDLRGAGVRRGRAQPLNLPRRLTLFVGGSLIHQSHRLRVHRGLLHCSRCGLYAVVRTKGLKHPCVPPTVAGTRALARIAHDARPWGLVAWPDQTRVDLTSRTILL